MERGPSGAEWHGGRTGCRLPAGCPVVHVSPVCQAAPARRYLHFCVWLRKGGLYVGVSAGEAGAGGIEDIHNGALAPAGEARRSNPGRGRSWSQVSPRFPHWTPSSNSVSCPRPNYAEGQGYEEAPLRGVASKPAESRGDMRTAKVRRSASVLVRAEWKVLRRAPA